MSSKKMNPVKLDAVPFNTSSPAISPTDEINTQPKVKVASSLRLPDFMSRRDEPCLIAEEKRSGLRCNPYPEKQHSKPVIIRQEGVTDLKPDMKVYPIDSRPKGLFLCLNNIKFEDERHPKRDGAEVDEKNLVTLYRKLGYRVQCFRDLDNEEFTRRVMDFSQRPELSKLSSVVICVMSHGEGNEVQDTDVVTTDGVLVSCEWIIKQFNVLHCPAMQNKPKIFLFQLCRGPGHGCFEPTSPIKKNIDSSVAHDGTMYSKRIGDDVFIAYSTMKGNVALRHITQGSWFVQALCTVYMRYACDRELGELHKKVDDELKYCAAQIDGSSAAMMQTCVTENRGFKTFYFCPGVYKD